MGKIQILDEHMTNLIAAGEVIERAKSVVKELVENSIDAGATSIKIQLENGGLTEIRVTDNGCGMDPQDANMCFAPHATSKIKNQNDLFNIKTLGFRGEALASIVAVSSFNLKTSIDGYHGIMLSLKGGIPLSEATISHPKGTEITVRNLFFSTPARLNHMKAPNVELAYITDFVSKIALVHKEISFYLSNNGKEIMHTTGAGNLLEVISEVYSNNIAKEMIEIFDNNGMFKVNGYISKISVTKASKNNIILCINGRLVYNKAIVNAVVEGYGNLLMNGRYPLAILDVSVDLGLVDVNVHPTKYEVRLSSEETLKEMITSIIAKTLSTVDLTADTPLDTGSLIISDFEEEEEENKESDTIINTNTVNTYHSTFADSFENVEENEEEEKEEEIIDAKTAISNLDESSFDDELDHLNDYIDNLDENSEDTYYPSEEDLDSLKEMDDYDDLLKEIDTEEENIEEYAEKEEEKQEKVTYNKGIQEEFSFLEEENFIKNIENTRLAKMYYIGQLFGTYILAQNEDSFFLIDQHAANERVNFEKIIKEFEKENPASYDLLVPISLEFSPAEAILVNENIDAIKSFGIELDEFGSNTFVVRSIPIWFFRGKEKELAEEIINSIIRSPKGQNYKASDFLSNIAATMACKKSIKGNEYHTSLEIEYLIEELAKCDNPFTCPHGRPIIIKLSRSDIEKWFKRIVS